MTKPIALIFGGGWGLALLVLALWSWSRSADVARFMGSHNVTVASLSIRCAAIALAALGEGLLAWLVVGTCYARDLFAKAVALSAAVVFLLSAASAVALGLAGR